MLAVNFFTSLLLHTYICECTYNAPALRETVYTQNLYMYKQELKTSSEHKAPLSWGKIRKRNVDSKKFGALSLSNVRAGMIPELSLFRLSDYHCLLPSANFFFLLPLLDKKDAVFVKPECQKNQMTHESYDWASLHKIIFSKAFFN